MENLLKTYNDTYLYRKYPLYNKMLTDAIVKDPILDKKEEKFQDVIYEVKRSRISESLVRVLTSNNVILLDCVKPLPRTFKVFCAKDFKGKVPNELKIYMDVSNVITTNPSSTDYNVDITKLVSFLINAMVTMVYHKKYKVISTKNSLKEYSASCFSKCFTHIIDYLTKVSIQESNKIKVLYLSSLYYLESVMCLDDDERCRTISRKIAGISDREAVLFDISIEKSSIDKNGKTMDPFTNIKTFIELIRNIMHFDKLTTDIVIEKWMQLYGYGTVFGLEYYPAFSAMLTDAYVGGYLNIQKTIETVCGKDMIEYSKEILHTTDGVA